MDSLLSGISAISIKDIIMIVIGCILIYLAIYKKFEPTLLLPMGFGVIMANLPLSGAITQGSWYIRFTIFTRNSNGTISTFNIYRNRFND